MLEQSIHKNATAATQLPRPELWQRVPTAIWLALETAQRFAEDQAGCRFFGTEKVPHQGHKPIPELWVMGSTGVIQRGPTGVRSPLE